MNRPSNRELLKAFAKVAVLSFGGPAGQIAVLHKVLVEERGWLDDGTFTHALNFCMLLPGPEAQQLVTWTGRRLGGPLWGVIAGTMFVLPGFFSILALSLLYVRHQELPMVRGVFLGLAPAVLAVVAQALMKLSGRVLKDRFLWGLAAAVFVGVMFGGAPFPLALLGAGAARFVYRRLWPVNETASAGAVFQPDPRAMPKAVKAGVFFLVLWLAPVIGLLLLKGEDHVFTQQAVFFSKAASISFGGAYALLGYLQEQAVGVFGWVNHEQMIHALSLAETTPGPLIQVVQFVGFLGAYQAAVKGGVQGLSPDIAGALASLLVCWVTFLPSFLWINLFSPFMERLMTLPALRAALEGTAAAAAGVILKVMVVFAGGVLLREGGWMGVSPPAVGILLVSLAALLRLKWGLGPVLALGVGLGLLTRLAG